MKGKKIPDFYEQFIIDEHNQRSRGSGYESLSAVNYFQNAYKVAFSCTASW